MFGDIGKKKKRTEERYSDDEFVVDDDVIEAEDDNKLTHPRNSEVKPVINGPKILGEDEIFDNGLVQELIPAIDLSFLNGSYLETILLDTNEEFITDIKYDGNYITIESGEKGKYRVAVTEEIMEQINYFLLELEKMNDKILNMQHPYLDMDVMIEGTSVKLRFSILHETLTNIKAVKSFCVRRNIFSKPFINDENVVDMFAGNHEAEAYVKNLITLNKKPNIIISGETGSGKTEFQKYVIGKIAPIQGIVSIQDTNDAALKKLYPYKDITEIFSNKYFSMSDGIKTALRYNPDWVIVAEIRGSEVNEFIEAMETGHAGITTLHASSAANTIDRMNNLNKKYTGFDSTEVLNKLVDVVIHIGVAYVPKEVDGKTIYVKKRLVDEIYEVKEKRFIHKINLGDY